jgi:hypothetical protein
LFVDKKIVWVCKKFLPQQILAIFYLWFMTIFFICQLYDLKLIQKLFVGVWRYKAGGRVHNLFYLIDGWHLGTAISLVQYLNCNEMNLFKKEEKWKCVPIKGKKLNFLKR